jgi:hypothetical protein
MEGDAQTELDFEDDRAAGEGANEAENEAEDSADEAEDKLCSRGCVDRRCLAFFYVFFLLAYIAGLVIFHVMGRATSYGPYITGFEPSKDGD